MIQSAYLKGVGYYKYHHYYCSHKLHEPKIIRKKELK